jgi:hypothetical protein
MFEVCFLSGGLSSELSKELNFLIKVVFYKINSRFYFRFSFIAFVFKDTYNAFGTSTRGYRGQLMGFKVVIKGG